MALNEKEIEKLIALDHFIKYLITNPEVEDCEIYDGIKRLESIGNFIIKNPNLEMENEVNKYLNLETMKDLIEKFRDIIFKRLREVES